MFLVPLAAYTVKIVDGTKLKLLVGIGTLILGALILGKIFLWQSSWYSRIIIIDIL